MAIFLAGILTALDLFAQTAPAPARLAIVPETPEAGTAADRLLVEFSKNNGLQLLERNEIARVYREQGMSAGNKDYVKLGQVLGADGLLLMETSQEGTNQFLNLRLLAVKPGVVLAAEKFARPVTGQADWAAALAGWLDPFLPKLTVLVKDAVPVSVVNFRSAIQSAEGLDTERQLKLLAIRRLTQERQLFVLERQKMQLLTGEKDLQLDDTAFWSGSYLLEGAVDQNGYALDTITINVRLTPRKGGAPLLLEVAGSRTNLAEVINQLAMKVDAALNVHPSITEWSAAGEAAQFFDEAKWAMKWGLSKEAQEASESAWALGLHTREVAVLRLQSYMNETASWWKLVPLRATLPAPEPANIDLATRMLELFNEGTRVIVAQADSDGPTLAKYRKLRPGASTTGMGYRMFTTTTNGASRAFANDMDWFDIGLDALEKSGAALQSFHESADARDGSELKLGELRALMRQTAAILETNVPPARGLWEQPTFSLNDVKWEDGGMWFDRPEDALVMYDQMLKTGFRSRDQVSDTFDGWEDHYLPQLAAWSWEDRKRIPKLLRQYTASLVASTNQDLQLEGLLYTLILTPNDGSGRLEAVENELFDRIWEQRQSLFGGRDEVFIMERIEDTLCHKFGIESGRLNREPFTGLIRRLRKDYLANETAYNRNAFDILFPWTYVAPNVYATNYSRAEALELTPQLKAFQQRLLPAKNDNYEVDQVLKALAALGGSEAASKPVPTPRTIPVASKTDTATGPAVDFVAWQMDLPAMDPEFRPVVEAGIIRRGKLWVQLWCCNPNRQAAEFRSFFAGVNLQTGAAETIPFPPGHGLPGQAFEVTADSLFAFQGDQLMRYRFQTRQWENIHAPIEGNPKLLESGSRIYLATSDAIFEFSPETQAMQVLASSRRHPALNPLDELGGFGKISAGTKGRLVALAQRQSFTYSPDTRVWTADPSPDLDGFRWYKKDPVQYVKDGQPIDPFNVPAARIQPFNQDATALPDPNRPNFWGPPPALLLNAPEGQVAVSPGVMGHWVTPKAMLVSAEEMRNFVLTNTASQKP